MGNDSGRRYFGVCFNLFHYKEIGQGCLINFQPARINIGHTARKRFSILKFGLNLPIF